MFPNLISALKPAGDIKASEDTEAASIAKIKECAKDVQKCVGDAALKMEMCGLFTINHENPDLEGDIATMGDGVVLTSSNTAFATGLSGGTRILEEVAQLLETAVSLSRPRLMAAETDKGFISAQLEGGMTVNAGTAASLLTKVGIVLASIALFSF